jgi:hypothetical protein
MDIYTIIISVVIGDSLVMALFVLFLNPKLSGKTAAKKIKESLLEDKDFIKQFLKDMVSFEDIMDSLFNKLRLKLQGTLLGDSALDKMIDRTISKEIRDSDPQIEAIISLLSEISPNYAKILKKHPELAIKLYDNLKKRGLVPDLSGDSEDQNGIIYGNT